MASAALRGAVALCLLLAACGAAAGTVIQVNVKLESTDARVAIDGVAALTGRTLSGRLSGEGADVALSGQVKNRSVSVELTGRIAPSCASPSQSVSGTGDNENEATSVELVLECAHGYLEETYHFRLLLALPPRNQSNPPSSEPGLSASME